jgi:tetratricopeptide (TPR) repeat protein
VGAVNHQSEHLSNAQIESYGDRSSGEGSEQGQRNDEQWVEAHLAECSSCRGLVLDFQRTHLFRDLELAGPGTGDRMGPDLKPGNPNPRDPQLPADGQGNTAATPDCPSKEDIRLLAAGMCSDATAARLTRHAATCDYCSALLRNFLEDFSDDFSPEEQAMLDQLASNSEAWQIKTAREMARSGAIGAVGAARAAAPADDMSPPEVHLPVIKTPVKPDPKPFFLRWFLIPATAACALVVFSVWYYVVRDTPEKVGTLLAQASTDRKTIQPRFPGAAWGPRVDTLGSRGPKPLSLLQAEEILARQQEKVFQDVAWVRVRAEKKILDGDPKKAIAELDKALQAQPDSIPLLQDLAIAYYQQGQRSSDQQDYKRSIEYSVAVLKRDPSNTVALFNRALAYEQMEHDPRSPDETASISGPDWKVAAWDAFLKSESDPQWAAEAQKRLTDLRRGNDSR